MIYFLALLTTVTPLSSTAFLNSTPQSPALHPSFAVSITSAIHNSHFSSHLSSQHATPHLLALQKPLHLHQHVHFLAHSSTQPTSKITRKESANRGRDYVLELVRLQASLRLGCRKCILNENICCQFLEGEVWMRDQRLANKNRMVCAFILERQKSW